MGNLTDLIREKQAQFDALSAELSVLRRELEEARTLLTADRGPKRGVRRGKKSASAGPTIKPDSSAGYAYDLLKEVGRPMHVDDLVAGIAQRGHVVNKGTLIGQVTRYVNRREVFTRPEPNTFGLLEWDEFLRVVLGAKPG